MFEMNLKETSELIINIVNKYYKKSKDNINTVSQKGLNDIVTDVDMFMEKNIINEISKLFPTHSFKAEESGEEIVNTQGDFYEWIIDPIDGTVNFAAGFPDFGIVVALQKNGETILGVNIFPELNETYVSIKGQGAYCNGKKLQVSANNNLSDCMVMVYIGSTYDEKLISQTMKLIAILTPLTRGIRIVGSSSVASSWVAAGKVDVIINLKKSVSLGSTAGRLFIDEAGGMVTNVVGHKRNIKDSMVCSNGKIHDTILNIINNVAKD